jgi:hypothetical protein
MVWSACKDSHYSVANLMTDKHPLTRIMQT